MRPKKKAGVFAPADIDLQACQLYLVNVICTNASLAVPAVEGLENEGECALVASIVVRQYSHMIRDEVLHLEYAAKLPGTVDSPAHALPFVTTILGGEF